MKINADYDRCEGHGLCVEAASRIFDLDDDGELVHHYADRELPPDLEADGRSAVDVCPVAALRTA